MSERGPLLRVTWLGTSSGLPTRDRDVSCVVVEVGKRLILLDAGEGAQLNLLRRGFNLSAIDAVLVTHRHGDHCFGLPGLYGTLWLMGRPVPPLVADEAVQTFLTEAQRITAGDPGDHRTVVLAGDGPEEVLTLAPRADTQVRVVAQRLDHRVPSWGFRIEATWRGPDRLRTERLKAEGIPRGPIFGRLQRGEDVGLPDGRVLRAEEVRIPGPVERASFVYLTDTRLCEASIALARDADLVSHEATFIAGQEPRAREMGHATADEALEVLTRSGARRMALTHFSARNPLAAYHAAIEAAGCAERAFLTSDGLSVELYGR